MNKKEINLLLDKHNLRKTPGMQYALDVFLESKKPITAEMVYDKIKKNVNQSTIYRILKRFLEAELIKEVKLSSEKKYYELRDRHHHHHIVCTSCESITDIPCIENIIEQIKPENYNFETIDDHTFELYGTCKDCK